MAGYPDSIIFSFTDGDGDIGTSGNTDTSGNLCGLQHKDSSILHSPNFNIFLIDSRDTCINPFASANIVPTGKYKGVSGDITVIPGIYSKFCYAPPDTGCRLETFHYSIILTDMAGHMSNIIQTSQIVCDPR
jgi:hypothetical protein